MTAEKIVTWKDWARGIWRSLTMRIAAGMVILPDALKLLIDNFPAVAPFIPDVFESRALQIAALVMLLLRIKTTTPLVHR